MNKLDASKRIQIVAALVEGNPIRSTVRMTGASKNNIAKLLVKLGAACSAFMEDASDANRVSHRHSISLLLDGLRTGTKRYMKPESWRVWG